MHRFGRLLLLLLAMAAPVSAQQAGSVTGTVTDSGNGQPIAGAQVFIPGLQLGALSNAQGRFLITNVPAGTREIRAELIGRATVVQTVTVQAGQAAQANFVMESRAISLEGVVVTGVASATPRAQLAFTVEKLDAAEMLRIAPVSAGTALQGKVAGARIVQGSGQPGSEPSIMFRGPTSITGSQAPLVIVDGVITEGGLASIDALDIESMEVVKGAAAASLYGSRAQAGVIQITTKRGTGLQEGRTEIVVRQIMNVNNIERMLGTAMAHPYRMTADRTAFLGRNGLPIKLPALTGDFLLDDGANGADSYRAFSDKGYPEPTWDVWRQAYQSGHSFSTYVSVGGNEGRTQYRASGRFSREKGTLAFVNGMDQKNFRINVDHRLTDALHIALSTYLTKLDGDDLQEGGVGANQFGYDPFLQLGFTSPMTNMLARDSTGRVSPIGDLVGWGENPLYRLATETNHRKGQRIMGGVDLDYTFSSWLSFEANASYDREDNQVTRYQPPGLPRAREELVPRTGYLWVGETTEQNINASLTGNLSATFGELATRLRLRWLAEGRDNTVVTATGSSLLVADVPRLSLATTGITSDMTQETVRSEGFFAVGALTWKDRYVVDVLGRRDGSSLFGSEERWQNYYRVAAAWRMAQEPWWPFSFVNEFKPRFSRGTAGGRPRFDAQYQTYYVGVGVIQPGILGNSQLKPEHATEHEFGFDAVVANRVSVQANYVRSRVDDQLLLTPLTSKYGFRSQWRNGGTLASTTYELQMETSLVERPNLLWTARLNLDRTTQRVTKLNVPPFRVEGYRAGLWVREGEVLGTFYGVKWANDCGLDLPAGADCSQFQINDDGLLVYVGRGNNWRDGIAKKLWGTKGSVNGVTYDWGIPIRSILDGGISKMGNTQPDVSLSLSHDVQWKSFGFSALFDSQFGGMIYHQTRAFACRDLRCPEADQTRKPDELKKPTAYYNRGGVYASNDNNSWFMERSDFVKLRELSLRYTVNERTLPSFLQIGIDRATINLTGRNVHTWSQFPGTDPEVGSDTFLGSAVVGRVDEYSYPNFRSFGIDIEMVF